MPIGPTFVNITQGKNARAEAPENLANGQAINPLKTIRATDAAVNDSADTGSNDLADNEMKINTGSAMSTTSLFAPPRSGLTFRL